MPREKVLIIEDDDNLQEALRYRLEQDGYVVHSAMDGEEGLDLAREVLPDLIILDIMLPVLDGLEVCRNHSPGDRSADYHAHGEG